MNPEKTEIRETATVLLKIKLHPCVVHLWVLASLSDVKTINDIRDVKTERIYFFLPLPPTLSQTKDGSRWVIFSSRGVTGVQIGSSMTKRLILTESLRLKEEPFAYVSLPGSCNCERRNTLQLCA